MELTRDDTSSVSESPDWRLTSLSSVQHVSQCSVISLTLRWVKYGFGWNTRRVDRSSVAHADHSTNAILD